MLTTFRPSSRHPKAPGEVHILSVANHGTSLMYPDSRPRLERNSESGPTTNSVQATRRERRLKWTHNGTYGVCSRSRGTGFSESQSWDKCRGADCGSDTSLCPWELLRRLAVEGPDDRRPRVTRRVPLRGVYPCESDRGVVALALGGYSGDGRTMGELGPGGGSGGLKGESMEEGMGDEATDVDLEMEGRSVEVDWRMSEAERTREDRDTEKVSGNSVER